VTERRKEKFLEVLRARQTGLTVVMEDIHDPHNVSAMLRSADAVGVGEVQLLYTKDKFPRLGKKSSASATKWIKRNPFDNVETCYEKLRKRGFVICATHLGKKSASLYDIDLTRNIAFVFGNEHRGVSDAAAKLADENFQIPMKGMIQSLNVSVACAVSLFEALRQRMESGMYGKPQLSRQALMKLFDEWSAK
jgi:tRNA (guanosine-2'-O-)-methyltransferase